MPVFLSFSPLSLRFSSSRSLPLPRPPPPSLSALLSFTAYENVRRRGCIVQGIARRAACIMERAGNDSAGKIADTRDGRDLQPDYISPLLSSPLHLPIHVEQCFPICYMATGFLGIRHRARNCVDFKRRREYFFLSFLIPFSATLVRVA